MTTKTIEVEVDEKLAEMMKNKAVKGYRETTYKSGVKRVFITLETIRTAAFAFALALAVSGCAITINTSKDGETANQSATPTIAPTVEITLPQSGE